MLDDLVQYQSDLQSRLDSLIPLFDLAAAGNTAHPDLRNFMRARGMTTETPAATAMASLEERYVAAVFNEIALMDKTAQASLRHTRLLLRSPRQIYNIREGGHVRFEEIIDTLAYEINSLMDADIPELIGTSYNFLTAMRSYRSSVTHGPDQLEAQLNATASEYTRVANAIAQSPLTDAQMKAFYQSYNDMSDQPRQDYVSSMMTLCGLYLDITHCTLDRIDLRIQGLDVLFRAQAQGLVNFDMAGAASLAEKIIETENMFIRADRTLNQSSVQMDDGSWRRRDGAQDYLQSVQAEFAAYPDEFRSICAPA